ncbi:hypothetical protein [Kocuria sp. SL71]|uniref:hypothetical protein n=1 Tax=Kocuria sp. SL71 TaxID=2995151 RepID=UPI002274CC85|nr:hypothetical protein [Kocuria sp. SL71]MCY1685123.1 hypothetical protein [Kocuria sp. SL71]
MYRVTLDLTDDQIDRLTTALEGARDRHEQARHAADQRKEGAAGEADERDDYDELLSTVEEAVAEADTI